MWKVEKPPKFTHDQWNFDNYKRLYICEAQKKLAAVTISKANNVASLTSEKVKSNKEDTDFRLNERIQEIENVKDELNRNRKDLELEIDALSIYKTRLLESLSALKEKSLQICEQCLSLREKRIGIDLVLDDVENELRKEIHLIKCSENSMKQLLKETEDALRRLRSTMYFIDRDLEDKENHLRIDRYNSSLKETNLNLSIYQGDAALDSSVIPLEKWKMYTQKSIRNSAKEIREGKLVRARVDCAFRNILNSLTSQKEATDNAFYKRINEIKNIKENLEEQHSEIMQQANEMMKNIAKLEKLIAEKEGYIALAHTRLGHRRHRNGLELVKDSVEDSLAKELTDLRRLIATLQQTLFDAQASLRFLLKLQIELEEDINVKTNSLKIDEVDCMIIRQSIEYRLF